MISGKTIKISSFIFALAVSTLLLTSNASPAFAPDYEMHPDNAGHEGMSMDMDMNMDMGGSPQMDPALQNKLLADKKESEFNHHLAGLFLILAGVFIFAQGALLQRWPLLRYAWPSCFLISGLFLLIFSDTELWPFGPQSWWYGLSHNPEDLQHKTFALILLALSYFEIQRARGVLKSAWAAWLFPALACCGSVLLLFHEHHTGMHTSDHMTVMARIQAEHRSFAATGFGIGIFKGLSELPTNWRTLFARLWPVLMIVLGLLLVRYVE
jgi:putative copper resistance protein D